MLALVENILEPQIALTVLVAIAVFASILTLAMPLLQGNRLDERMKGMTDERARIRKQERAKLFDENRSKLRQAPTKSYMKQVVDNLNLQKLMNADSARDKLKMAGFRSPAATITFMFFRVVLPPAVFVLTLAYFWFINDFGKPPMIRLLMAGGAGFVGFYLPNIFISNAIQKRQKSLSRAFPDSLDLLLICVESGMSIEMSFRKVSEEIGSQSLELAEEMILTTAELSYLSERRQAYENLAKRTGLDGVKAVATALIQAEKYGTPVGTALRVMAQENRDMRMAAAEKKAAGLPPKLTVPMILFFLPVLFVVILGPAAIQVMGLD